AGLKTRPTTDRTPFAKFLRLQPTRPGETAQWAAGRVLRPGDTTRSPARGEKIRAQTAGLKTRPTTGRIRFATFLRLQTTQPDETTWFAVEPNSVGHRDQDCVETAARL